MNKDEFKKIVEEPEHISENHLEALNSFAQEHPYSQIAQLLYAIGLRHSSEHLFTQQLGNASILTNDRSVLFELFENNNYLAKAQEGITAPVHNVGSEPKDIHAEDQMKPKSESVGNSAVKKEEPIAQDEPEGLDNLEDAPHTNAPDNPKEIDKDIETAERSDEENADPSAKDEGTQKQPTPEAGKDGENLPADERIRAIILKSREVREKLKQKKAEKDQLEPQKPTSEKKSTAAEKDLPPREEEIASPVRRVSEVADREASKQNRAKQTSREEETLEGKAYIEERQQYPDATEEQVNEGANLPDPEKVPTPRQTEKKEPLSRKTKSPQNVEEEALLSEKRKKSDASERQYDIGESRDEEPLEYRPKDKGNENTAQAETAEGSALLEEHEQTDEMGAMLNLEEVEEKAEHPEPGGKVLKKDKTVTKWEAPKTKNEISGKKEVAEPLQEALIEEGEQDAAYEAATEAQFADSEQEEAPEDQTASQKAGPTEKKERDITDETSASLAGVDAEEKNDIRKEESTSREYPFYEDDDDALEDDSAFDESEVENEDEKDDDTFEYGREVGGGIVNRESDAYDEEADREEGSFSSWLKQITDSDYETQTPIEKERAQRPKEPLPNEPANIEEKMELLDSFVDKLPGLKTKKILGVNTQNIPVEEPIERSTAMVTETLARIYARQGHHEKALQAYNILKLKYPEKKELFASQIADLKKKL